MGGIIMNENLDLTKILDGCPSGTEFYSIIFGNVPFIRINHHEPLPIVITTGQGLMGLTADGRYFSQYDGECTLFPSKEQRDWSKFERFWDNQKVERFDPKTLQPFDRILARDYKDDIWTACLYSHKAKNLADGWFVCDSAYRHYIIPYNDETKHLVGTNNDCPEYYKWWEDE